MEVGPDFDAHRDRARVRPLQEMDPVVEGGVGVRLAQKMK